MITKAKLAISDSGLKQYHVARNIGTEMTLLSRYISGERQMPFDVAKKLAKFLKVPLSNIIDDNVREADK